MINKEKNIEFLDKIAAVPAVKISPAETSSAVNRLFKTYLGIEKTEFIIWDNSSMLLRDFSAGWEICPPDSSLPEINFIYNSLVLSKGEKFYFNEEEFSCSIKTEDEYRIFDLKSDNNTIIFPLVSNGEVFGLIKMFSRKNAFTKEFFSLLNISSKLISGAVINYILNEQMEISLNFYSAMKDIAKIIESQYELNYIIPLIGEMIDRFMSNHLIYIFMNKDSKFKLVWPKACKDENIYRLLEKITPGSEYIISDDYKIGVFPIISEEKIIGAVTAYSSVDRLAEKDIDYLVQLTRQSALTIHRANVYAEVLKYAALDALTGLNNRRQFEIRLRQEVSKSRRNSLPLCGIMLDADYFKKVNDTYGHAAGDAVLKKTAEIIMQEMREYDTAFRYGGEEFFIILPGTKLEDAFSAAERLRRTIEKTDIEIIDSRTSGPKNIRITASIGLCAYNSSMDAEEFAALADKALYKAKETGRNRVMTLEE